MRRIRIIILSLILFIPRVSIFAQDVIPNCFITGHFNGADNGNISMLSENGDSIIAQGPIHNGTFNLVTKVTDPQQYLFSIMPGNWNFRAIIQSGEIKILVDTTGAERYGNPLDKENSWALIWNVEQTGSPVADDYARFKKETNEKNATHSIKSIYKRLDLHKEQPDSVKAIEQEINRLQNNLLTTQKEWFVHFNAQNPQSLSGPFLLYELFQRDPNPEYTFYQTQMGNFQDEAKASHYYRLLIENTTQLANRQLNTPAPDFSLLQENGSTFSLSSLQGKYVLLDFWASWCAPCRAAIPKWKSIFDKYKNKGLEIVGISGDRDANAWRKALLQEKMPWIQVIDSFPSKNESAIVSNLYAIPAFPHYILINKAGEIIAADTDAEIIKAKIEEVFKNL
jgi:thiol-disulfide isomerase/thioredoxin